MRAPPCTGSRVPLGMPTAPDAHSPAPLRPSDPPRHMDCRDLALGFLEGTSHQIGCLLLQAARLPCLVCPRLPVVWDPTSPPSSRIICVPPEALCRWPALLIACSQAADFSRSRFSASFAAELCPRANVSLLVLAGGGSSPSPSPWRPLESFTTSRHTPASALCAHRFFPTPSTARPSPRGAPFRWW